MNAKEQQNILLMKRASRASIAVALTLIACKALAFVMTGSVAILSGLFDSVQDLMTSGVNMIAVHHATEPADKEHRFGHGKAQAIGSLIQGLIIFAAAVFLAIEAWGRFQHPQPLERPLWGVVVTLVAIALTVVLVQFQSYVIARTQSLSIRTDQAHYTGDILMNVGVLISMAATTWLGWTRVDALFGMGVAGYLFTVVYQVIRDSFKMLMDTEMPDEFRKQIQDIVHSFPVVSRIHDLRTRQSGSHAFIQFCIHLNENMTLRQAHDITDMIEDRIREHFPDAEVIIHPEPERKHL